MADGKAPKQGGSSMKVSSSASCVILAGVIGFTASLASPGVVVAEPVTLKGQYHFPTRFGANTVGRPVGDYLEFGVVAVDTATMRVTPPGTTVSAINSNAPGMVYDLVRETGPLFPTEFDRTIPYDANLAAGTWTFNAVNMGDVASPVSASANTAAFLPLATNLQVTANGLLPTVRWNVPAGTDIDRIRLRIFDDATNVQFFTTNLAPNTTSYEVKAGQLPGAGDFTFRVMLENFGTTDPNDTLGYSRSSAFINHTILPADVSLVATNTYHFRDTRSPNSAGFAPGDYLTFGAAFVLPNGDEDPRDGFADNPGVPKLPTTGIGRQFDGQGNPIVERPLGFFPKPGIPNDFAASHPYDPVLADNAWEITFTNGSETVDVSTPIPGAAASMPFVENFSLMAGGTTPTFTWTVPDGIEANRVELRIYDLESFLDSGIASVALLTRLPGNTTTYTPPEGFLLEHHLYSVDVQLDDQDDSPSKRLLSRSRSFFDFSTADVVLPPGVPPTTPVFMPQVDPFASPSGGPVFSFAVDLAGPGTIFVDPLVAVGFDYAIGDGDPLFTSVQLPDVGDGEFDLWLFDVDGEAFDTLLDIVQGQVFDFTTQLLAFVDELGYDPSTGLRRFRILGIELDAGVDPNDPTGFVTGLGFGAAGRFTGTMKPITRFVAASEPETMVLFAFSVVAVGLLTLRLRPASAAVSRLG
jgi:hypothetical protein